MIININNVLEKEERENVLKVLKELNLDFNAFDCATNLLAHTESDFNLSMWEDENGAIEKDQREEILNEISEDVTNDSYLIEVDGDGIAEIVDKVIKRHEGKLLKQLLDNE